MAFTVPWVPTGMKTGVRTSPWAVVIRPRRAREFGSVFSQFEFEMPYDSANG